MEVLNIQKVLFIQTAFIGDAILCLPAIQQFRKKEPTTLISVICIPLTEEIFRNSPSVDNVIVLDKRGKHKSILEFIRFTRQIREMNFNRIFSFHRSFRTAFLILESKVKETYGFSNAALKYVYKYLINYNHKDHEVKRNLSLVGLNVTGNQWQVLPEINTNGQDNVNNFLETNTLKDFITIAPGSIWGTKRYPVEYFQDIIKEITKKDIKVVLIGSKNDKELCSSLCINKNTISAAGFFSLTESIAFLKKSLFLISNDSSPAHMGMCADIPVLMIYCSTVPDFGFYPYNNKSTIVSFEDLKCKPCGIHGYDKCPLGHFKCGFELKAERIIQIINEKFL